MATSRPIRLAADVSLVLVGVLGLCLSLWLFDSSESARAAKGRAAAPSVQIAAVGHNGFTRI